jgi:hypothetical protein
MKDIKLEDHEVLCPRCNGTGKGETHTAGDFVITPECRKCYGEGKLDWIERIVGKPRRLFGEWHSSTEEMNIPKDLMDKMAKEIADSIDKEIIESILKEEEQNTKKGGLVFDHRVFSKHVLQSSFE